MPPQAYDVADVDRLASIVRYLIIGAVGLSAIDVLLEMLLIRAFDRDLMVWEAFETAGTLYDMTIIVGIIRFLVFVAAGISVMILFKRMMNNGAKLAPGLADLRSHWAITGWFIPFLSFVRPYQVVDQIWQTSPAEPGAGYGMPLPGLAKVWWGLFLAANYFGWVVPTVAADGTATTSDYANDAIGQLVISVLDIGAGVAFLLLLTALVGRHRRSIGAWTG